MILPFGSEAVKIVTVHTRHSQNRIYDAHKATSEL